VETGGGHDWVLREFSQFILATNSRLRRSLQKIEGKIHHFCSKNHAIFKQIWIVSRVSDLMIGIFQ
jgi:hypothetical protein